MLPDLTEELEALRTGRLHRSMRLVDAPHDPVVRLDGREVLLFCSNNYLGLANDQRVKETAARVLDSHGVSAPASRLISGHTVPHASVERRFADFFGTESALVYPSGYAANLGVIPALVGPGDAVFSDRLNHRSLIDACRLSRAEVVVYDHLDVDDLARQLDAVDARRRLIVTDGVFSMDGDLAPLDAIADVARRHDAILMVDDAHGTGIFGKSGRGTPEHFGVAEHVDVWMTSCSKGIGTFGGVIAGRGDLVDLLVNRSPAFIYTTAIPPDICAATVTALDILDAEPDRRERLLDISAHVRASLTELGYDCARSESHIIPVVLGDAGRTLDVADFLVDRGIFVLGIRPPTVPDGASRLRISLMSTHTDAHVEQLLGALSEARSAVAS